MRYYVTAKPRAHGEQVAQIDATHFVIAVKEPPIDGKANEAIARALADFLDIPTSSVEIVKGHTAKKKVFEIAPH